jgi:hypothetical protein
MKRKKIPQSLISLFWPYNLEELDLKRDKELIVTQILNYGNWQDLKWLYSVYSEKDIKEVLSNPRRGMWFERTLNFWEKVLNLRIPKKIRQKAIFKIHPDFEQKL